jgi:L-iditol 2-dehydrogenase
MGPTVPDIPAEMTVAVLHASRSLRIERRPTPKPSAGEVLLRVEAVGVCGSDLHYFYHGRSGSSSITSPTIIGHEFAGTIVAVGPGVPPERIGERVSVEPGIACRNCQQCRLGRYNLCLNMQFLGAAPIDGALQQFLAVPTDNAFAVPPDVTTESAALIEPLSVAMWAVERTQIGPAKKVLITGAGPIGILSAQVAAVCGAGDITIIDTNVARLNTVSSLTNVRAYTPEHWANEPGTVDVLIECTGSPAALESAMPRLNPAATIALVGVGPERLTLPMDIVQEREISIIGSHRYRHTWPAAIDLVARGAVRLDALVTDRFPLALAEEALQRNRHETAAMKVIIHPQK